MIKYLACLGIAIFLLACSSGAEKEHTADTLDIAIEQPLLPATHPIEQINYQPQVSTLTGTHYCYIRKVYRNGDRYFIDADLIEFFRGEAAVEAAKKAGEAETRIDEQGDTIYSVPDDYYIINPEEDSIVFAIDRNAKIKLWLFTEEGDIIEAKGIEDLQKKDLKYSPFILELENGMASQVLEQYVP
jgi:hypothetical protein